MSLPTNTLILQKKTSSNTSNRPTPPSKKNVATKEPPTHILNNWYNAYWHRINSAAFKLAHPAEKKRSPQKEHFSTWSNLQVQGNIKIKLFTSVYVCPWSGERFLSGKLIDKQMQYMEQDFELGVQGSEEGVETRKLVWYRKFISIDCLQLAIPDLKISLIYHRFKEGRDECCGR